MDSIAHAHCYHHGEREAVARCPECGHYFCRECITKHDGRVICADCLLSLVKSKKKDHAGILRLFKDSVLAGTGLFLIWFLFYQFAMLLITNTDMFHNRWLQQ